MEYDDNNKGALWKTEDSSKKYILNGKVKVDGKEMLVFAYKNETENDRAPAINLSFVEPNNVGAKPAPAPAAQVTAEDLPF